MMPKHKKSAIMFVTACTELHFWSLSLCCRGPLCCCDIVQPDCELQRLPSTPLSIASLCREKVAGFGEEEAAKKGTQSIRKVIPKIENTFNVEEYARQRKAR